ncbi:MAG: diacylglycerol kinase [Puniceicoccaceae bacterium]
MEARREADGVKPFRTGGVRRLWLAAGHSAEGLGAALKHEAAFRQECMAAAVLVPLALLLSIPVVDKVLLIGAVFFVLITELLNTAVECCVDYISFDLHPFAKRAKDIGSAAVFLSLVAAVLTWGLVLLANWPPAFVGG